MSETLLEIKDRVASFQTDSGLVRAVDGVSFSVERGKTVGVVGESGCGKTVTAMSIIDLLPKPSGQVLQGSINFKGEDLCLVSEKRRRNVRGNEIGVIFHEPMAALNPVHRIGRQSWRFFGYIRRSLRVTLSSKQLSCWIRLVFQRPSGALSIIHTSFLVG